MKNDKVKLTKIKDGWKDIIINNIIVGHVWPKYDKITIYRCWMKQVNYKLEIRD